MTNKVLYKAALPAIAIAALLSACGSDAEEVTATTVAEAEATTTTEAMADEDAGTIVDIAVENGNFTTLVAALQAAELDGTLSGDGPFTVFAPTDDAFAALPAGTVDTLLEDPKGDLTDILTFHVVSGKLLAAEVLAAESLDSLQGGALAVDADAGTIGGAVISTTDIVGSNGVIHVIDSVLIPE